MAGPNPAGGTGASCRVSHRRKTRKAKRKPQPRWASWPDERLLKLRLKDLKLTLRGNGLAGRLRELNAELADKGLRVRPHAWLSSEWFSPDNTPGHRRSRSISRIRG